MSLVNLKTAFKEFEVIFHLNARLIDAIDELQGRVYVLEEDNKRILGNYKQLVRDYQELRLRVGVPNEK